jgi:hypothetical protein
MDVNLQLVREFFELNMFHVLTNWEQPGEHGTQLFVENSNPLPSRELEFILGAADVRAIERAVVEVRAWHGDRFYPSVIQLNPVLSHFADEASLALAREVFGSRTFTTVLVISELPVSPELQSRSVELLRAAGVGHVLEFPAILQDMVNKVSVSGTYAASQTLEMLRLLKRYRLLRQEQLEFRFPKSGAAVKCEASTPLGPEEVEEGS